MKELLTCRRILCLMVILCFMCHYMVRVNISIAIVDMVVKNDSNTTWKTHGRHFDWNEHEKNDILGCFFWGFLLTAIPGGRLSEIYGTRLVLGTAMLLASFLTILTPFACYWNYYCAILVRTGLGLALGVSWPSIPPMAIRWVASADTSKFMAHTIACALGAALALPICGSLIAYLGWPSVFYVTGTITLVWAIAWFYLVYDSPGQHPRISKEEKEALDNEIGCNVNLFEKKKFPWKNILTSGPVWAIIVADICLQFNTNLVLSELPSYMKHVLHYNIKQNGLLSSLPYLATYAMAVICTHLGDKWGKTRRVSTITIRKVFTTLTFLVPIILFIVQIFWGNDHIVSISVFTLSQGFMAASTAGFLSNSMDISPMYAGTIFGIAHGCGGATGYISTKLVAFITKENQNFEQWRYIFGTLIGINLIGLIFYLVFASGELQKWNPKYNEEEMTTLKREKVKLDDDLNATQAEALVKKAPKLNEMVVY